MARQNREKRSDTLDKSDESEKARLDCRGRRPGVVGSPFRRLVSDRLKLLLGQYQKAFLGDGHGVLILGGQASVHGPVRPTVVVDFGPVLPRAQHRFTGAHHSRLQWLALIRLVDVGYLVIFVHSSTDSVFDKLSVHRISLTF